MPATLADSQPCPHLVEMARSRMAICKRQAGRGRLKRVREGFLGHKTKRSNGFGGQGQIRFSVRSGARLRGYRVEIFLRKDCWDRGSTFWNGMWSALGKFRDRNGKELQRSETGARGHAAELAHLAGAASQTQRAATALAQSPRAAGGAFLGDAPRPAQWASLSRQLHNKPVRADRALAAGAGPGRGLGGAGPAPGQARWRPWRRSRHL